MTQPHEEHPYDILRSWHDGIMPTNEEIQIVVAQRDFLVAMAKKYTAAIEEWIADERIRYTP